MTKAPGRENWEYLPEYWACEIAPEYQADINAFVHKNDDGTFALRPPKDSGYHDSDWHTTPLAHGGRVQFLAVETFENFELTVFEDGFSAQSSSCKMSANIFQIWSGDHECNEDDAFDSLKDLVDTAGLDGKSLEPQRLQPGKYIVRAWWHSPDAYPYLFEVDAAGNGRFVRQDVH